MRSLLEVLRDRLLFDVSALRSGRVLCQQQSDMY
jgi:hypothetical protein